MKRYFYRMWWISFWLELKEIIFPGVGWLRKSLPTAIAAIAIFLGFQVDNTISIDVIPSITSLAVGALVCFAVGYSAAMASSAKMILDDTLHLDEANSSLRLYVRCVGNGEIEPVATIVDLRDVNGNQIHPTAVCGLELDWHGQPNKKVKIKEGGPPTSVSVFWNTGGCLYVYGSNHKQPIDQNKQVDPSMQSIYVKIRVDDPQCKLVEQWYAIERDTNISARYRPCLVPDGLIQLWTAKNSK
ncbi:MAG TPA: hypothetical protein VG097_15610 [Gemmata sp.]|jgi:hypothetical protein|nr:hypothetical protein [Gemmata sp.]